MGPSFLRNMRRRPSFWFRVALALAGGIFFLLALRGPLSPLLRATSVYLKSFNGEGRRLHWEEVNRTVDVGSVVRKLGDAPYSYGNDRWPLFYHREGIRFRVAVYEAFPISPSEQGWYTLAGEMHTFPVKAASPVESPGAPDWIGAHIRVGAGSYELQGADGQIIKGGAGEVAQAAVAMKGPGRKLLVATHVAEKGAFLSVLVLWDELEEKGVDLNILYPIEGP